MARWSCRSKAVFLYIGYVLCLWYLKDLLVETEDGKRTDRTASDQESLPSQDAKNKFYIPEIRPICDMNIYLGKYKQECSKLIPAFRERGSVQKTTAKNKAHNQKEISKMYCSLEILNTDCSQLRQILLYGKEGISSEEVNFPLAFALKIHRNGNQAFRLLRLIYRVHNIYCIHVDKKASADLFHQFNRIADCVENIIVIQDRVNVVYSSIRQVEAEFKCMDAVRNSNIQWRYYINLTGEEFMLRTNRELVMILKLLNGTNDIESYNSKGFEHRFKTKARIVNQMLRTSKEIKTPFSRKIQIRKGSAYGMFTKDFIEFTRTNKVAQEFVIWLKDTYAPEEIIWATLNTLPQAPGGYSREVTHMNSTFLSRAMIWNMEDTICHGKYVHWVCIFGEKDLPWLLKQNEIVANKFYDGYGGLVLDCLERYLYDRTMFPHLYPSLNLTIYSQTLMAQTPL